MKHRGRLKYHFQTALYIAPRITGLCTLCKQWFSAPVSNGNRVRVDGSKGQEAISLPGSKRRYD